MAMKKSTKKLLIAALPVAALIGYTKYATGQFNPLHLQAWQATSDGGRDWTQSGAVLSAGAVATSLFLLKGK